MANQRSKGHFNPADFLKYWVISDLHSVYLDKRAFSCFLQAYGENESDGLYINGDLLDLPMMMAEGKHKIHALEGHSATLDEEIEFTTENILKPLRRAKKRDTVIFKPGNHCDRLIRILAGNLPGLQQLVEAGLKRNCLQFESLLRFDEFRIKVSRGDKRNGRDTDVDFIRKMGGRAALLHGTATNKQRLKQYLTFFLCNGTSGHTHRMDTESLPWYGGTFTWVESGCLCRKSAIEWMPIGKDPGWQHGWVTIWVSKKTGEVFVKGHPISEAYQVVFQGQVFTA